MIPNWLPYDEMVGGGSEPACANCRFWECIAVGIPEDGRCKRYPPRIIGELIAVAIRGDLEDPFDSWSDVIGYGTVFPDAPADEFCGEWQLCDEHQWTARGERMTAARKALGDDQ